MRGIKRSFCRIGTLAIESALGAGSSELQSDPWGRALGRCGIDAMWRHRSVMCGAVCHETWHLQCRALTRRLIRARSGNIRSWRRGRAWRRPHRRRRRGVWGRRWSGRVRRRLSLAEVDGVVRARRGRYASCRDIQCTPGVLCWEALLAAALRTGIGAVIPQSCTQHVRSPHSGAHQAAAYEKHLSRVTALSAQTTSRSEPCCTVHALH